MAEMDHTSIDPEQVGPSRPRGLGILAPGLVALTALWLSQAGTARAHGAHGGSVGVAGHSGAGISTLEPDEGLAFALDLFGYFSGAIASGWRVGEPLGPGGKLPLYYNQNLYKEGPYERLVLTKKDLHPQYRDFSYLPLWQPPQLGARVQYRFLPSVQGTVTAITFGSLDRVTDEPTPIEFAELFIRWSPVEVPGVSLQLGRLFLLGAYSVPFDQFPLESFALHGAAVRFQTTFDGWGARIQLAAGRTPIGRTTRVEDFDPEPVRNPPALDGVRARNHAYLSAGLDLFSGLSFSAVGGYQILPEDRSTANDFAPVTTFWPRASGWHAGAGLAFVRGGFEQNLVASHGSGDVEMAWGAPDHVYRPENNRLLRASSTLSQLVYWGSVSGRRLALAGGAWAQWRRPARQEHLWTVFRDGEPQSVLAATQDFRAIKVNLTPTFRIGALGAGVRVDAIHYLDESATTNTIEPLTDQALRPVFVPGDPNTRLVGPSLWEREAVDATIVSPFVELMAGPVFKIRATWSGAWYGQPIHRQRRVGSFHANLTLSAWLIYRFDSDVPDTTAGPPAAPSARAEGH